MIKNRFLYVLPIIACILATPVTASEGVTGIYPNGAISDSDIPDSLRNFDYDIYNGEIILKKVINNPTLIYVDSSYEIGGVTYKTNIDDFMIGIGNKTVESVVFSYGIEKVYDPVFNSCNVKNVYFPITLKTISDNTLSYLHPDSDGEKIKIYYEGSQDDWMKIFTAYERTPVSEAEFGEEMGSALADWVNDKIGSVYDASNFVFYFNSIPENLVYGTVPETTDNGESTNVEPVSGQNSSTSDNLISNPYVGCDVGGKDFIIGDVVYNQYYDGEFRYDAIVPIINTSNHNLYLKDCKFDIEDESGHLLGTYNNLYHCPDIIEPGETGYFYNPYNGYDVVGDVPGNHYIRISPVILDAKGQKKKFDVSDTSLREGDFGLSLIGRVTNNTNEAESMCYINVVYFNENGTAIGITGTNVMDLEIGVPVSFEISGMGLQEGVEGTPNLTYSVIAEADYYQFD